MGTIPQVWLAAGGAVTAVMLTGLLMSLRTLKR